MFDLVRDSTVGGFLNHISNGRILPYADQKPGYQLPKRYLSTQVNSKPNEKSPASPASVRTSHDDPERGGVIPADVAIAISKEARHSQGTAIDDNVVDPNLVDWDGPQDPDNPM